MDRPELLKLIGDAVGPMVKDAVEAQYAKLTTPQGPTARAFAPPSNPSAQDKGLMFGRMARAIAGAGKKGSPAEFAEKTWKDEMGQQVVKALQATTEVAGGYLIAEQTSTEVIELLRPKVVVRAMGTPTMPMETGTLRLNKLTAAAAAGYIGEDQDIPVSQETFGRVVLNWKKLAALVPVSNDILRFATPSADGIVRDDIIRVIRITEDRAFIRGAGTQNTPKGIRNWAPAANLIPVSAEPITLANVTVDLGNLLLALMNANVGFTNVGWMFAPRTLVFLMTIRDGLGNYAFRAELLTGKLWGYPYGVTTQIPTNLGDGTESEVYCVDFADIVIGEATQMIMAVSEEAAYVQNGQLVSAFSRDETLIRVIEQHDIGSRHDESIAVLTGCEWGAVT